MKKLSLVDSLERELENYLLKVDKLIQPTSIVLLFWGGLSGYESIYEEKCACLKKMKLGSD